MYVLCRLLTFCHPGALGTKYRSYISQTAKSLHLSFPSPFAKAYCLPVPLFFPLLEKSPSLSKIGEIKLYQCVDPLMSSDLRHFPES